MVFFLFSKKLVFLVSKGLFKIIAYLVIFRRWLQRILSICWMLYFVFYLVSLLWNMRRLIMHPFFYECSVTYRLLEFIEGIGWTMRLFWFNRLIMLLFLEVYDVLKLWNSGPNSGLRDVLLFYIYCFRGEMRIKARLDNRIKRRFRINGKLWSFWSGSIALACILLSESFFSHSIFLFFLRLFKLLWHLRIQFRICNSFCNRFCSLSSRY